MFTRMFLIFFVTLFAFCVVPMVALAQDGGDIEEQPNLIPFTFSNGEFRSSSTLQSLQEAGLSVSDIDELQSVLNNQPTHLSPYSQSQSDMTRWFLRQCDVGHRSWIVFDIGSGGLGNMTTYQQFSNLEIVLVNKESNACPVDSICGFIAWVKRAGLAPFLWGIRYNGPVSARHSWCSRW